MNCKVCKFGGTSMADGNIIQRAADIIKADESRRYVVVSAPGKRFSDDVKITDLLYACSDALDASDQEKFKKIFSKIRTRFLNIEKELGKDIGMADGLNEVEQEMLEGAGRD